jgi:acetylornithine deacetylase
MSVAREVAAWIERERDYILDTVSGLVRVQTENLPPTGNERPGQEYLHDRIAGFVPEDCIDLFEVDEVRGIRAHPLFFPTIEGRERIYRDRPILVARRPGKGGGKSIAFSGHMDTMPTYGKEWTVFKDPYSGRIKDGLLYGRGAVDMKAGTVAGFLAIKCLHDLGIELRGDVYAESVVDEENGGVNGTIAARLRNPRIDFAILSEPSGLAVGVESIGGSDWKATVAEGGPGGIGPEVGLSNPIYTLSRVALALEKYDGKLAALAPPAVFDPEIRLRLLTYQIASGGVTYQDSGAVPTSGHIHFWLETFAGTEPDRARDDFLDFMREELSRGGGIGGALPRFETVIRTLEGHRTDRNHPALASIRGAYDSLGIPYAEKGVPFGTDAFAFRKVSRTDVAIIGPAGKNIHGVDEYVEIDSLLKLIQIMVLTAFDFCG